MKTNKHAVNMNTVTTWIAVIIGIVVLFQVLASLFPTLLAAGDSLNASGFPLGSLFATGGAIWYILAAAVIYLLVRSFGGSKK